MKQIKLGAICAALIILLAGCSKNVSNPNDENEHEAINKIELVLQKRVVLLQALLWKIRMAMEAILLPVLTP